MPVVIAGVPARDASYAWQPIAFFVGDLYNQSRVA